MKMAARFIAGAPGFQKGKIVMPAAIRFPSSRRRRGPTSQLVDAIAREAWLLFATNGALNWFLVELYLERLAREAREEAKGARPSESRPTRSHVSSRAN